MSERRVIILGSTGSIGTQAIEAIEHLNALHARGEHPRSYRVVGLAAGKNAALLMEQSSRLHVRNLAINVDPEAVPRAMEEAARSGSVRFGSDGPERMVREVECDVVLAAMVGVAGLPATLAAAELGRDIALANKETLVAAGSLVTAACRASGSRLLPVDSEHSGVFQLLAAMESGKGAAPPMALAPDVARVILTASGGPFRTWTREQIACATRADALRHPTWAMGRKVTIDSASLMNKALELIEAHWLFGVAPEKLGAVIHPQSIVHAMVERIDGTTLMQAAAPDMRTPILQALAWPHAAAGCGRRMDPLASSCLEFSPPDPERFPALGLAFEAMRMGGTAGAILNAANEEAVSAYIGSDGSDERCVVGPMPFSAIAEVAAWTLRNVATRAIVGLDDVLCADGEARLAARARLREVGVVAR
jgi:1-deoxy-D-xylulose-5-phosphate reductoisomerase